MAPKAQEVKSQATPLSEDILAILRGQLAEGGLGEGVGPLQREAGTAARQFVEAGGGKFDLSPLLKQLQEIQQQTTEENVGNLREGFGIAGSRFGTPLAESEGRLRRDLATRFGAQTGELLRGEFGAQMDRLLSGIGTLQGIGQQNISPFLQFAAMGINPETFTENPFVTGINLAANVGKGVASVATGAPI